MILEKQDFNLIPEKIPKSVTISFFYLFETMNHPSSNHISVNKTIPWA